MMQTLPAAMDSDVAAFMDQHRDVLAGLSLPVIDKHLAEKSLREYIELAWPILEPANQFVPGWHIDAICEHLQAISAGQIRRLIINIPPRHMKSLGVAAFWPSWDWGPNNHPELRWLFSSYADSLAIRDSRKTRNIIQSNWYQANWGDRFQLVGDQNAKQKFENDHLGYRLSTTVRGVGTGEGGDRIVVDDPHNVREVESPAKRIEALLWWDESMSTRGDNPETVAFLIIMQRSHSNDMTGHVLAKESGYELLCLPARYEGENRIFTSIGKPDPRTEPGELLWPQRFNDASLAAIEKDLNSSYAVAGQMQQRPAPREGGSFKPDNFQIVTGFDRSLIVKSVRYWDKAGTKGGTGAATAGVLMHKMRDDEVGADGEVITEGFSFLIEDVQRGRWEAPERERMISAAAVLDGRKVVIWVEQEPGSGGKESAQATQRRNSGYTVRLDKVTGSKATRAENYETAVEAKNVALYSSNGRGNPLSPWIKPFLDEHGIYPNGLLDQIDAAGGAFNKLTERGTVYTA